MKKIALILILIITMTLLPICNGNVFAAPASLFMVGNLVEMNLLALLFFCWLPFFVGASLVKRKKTSYILFSLIVPLYFGVIFYYAFDYKQGVIFYLSLLIEILIMFFGRPSKQHF